MAASNLLLLLLLLSFTVMVVPWASEQDVSSQGSCSDNCLPEAVLYCKEDGKGSRVCANCCRIQGTVCTLKFLNGTSACSKPLFPPCPDFCMPVTPFKCRDPVYVARCESCVFPSCSFFISF